jgi:hypothetical protein
LRVIVFLYRQVLEQGRSWFEGMAQAKKPERLPVMPACAELYAVLARLS